MAKVRNIFGRTGHPVVNQFIITTADGEYFQSYETVIAFRRYQARSGLTVSVGTTATQQPNIAIGFGNEQGPD